MLKGKLNTQEDQKGTEFNMKDASEGFFFFILLWLIDCFAANLLKFKNQNSHVDVDNLGQGEFW